ncbi:hypothetical protein [Bradyrhizobium sp. I71]|uniref:hypothetical protein n=1 Tax=Bradyrhizobium sp. I71 TaxID=2590772 RepID=UPI001EF79E1C|nr:hypothetical protein [Bradyrhizobium sp. I71]ULK96315.1 hypothetical protein FJV43_26770 [Bradyrhizobium sp. I71]
MIEINRPAAIEYRRLGPDQAIPNPQLAEYQIDEVAAYLEMLRAGPLRQNPSRSTRALLARRLISVKPGRGKSSIVD